MWQTEKSRFLTVVKMRVCFALNKCFEILAQTLLYKSLPDILLYRVFGNEFGKRGTIKIDTYCRPAINNFTIPAACIILMTQLSDFVIAL